MAGETFVVVDNRLVQAKQAITSCDFAQTAASSNLASLTAMVLGRLLVLSSEHRAWVPQPTVCSARNASEVQEVRRSSINEAVACISTDLKPLSTFDGGGAESGPASTWKYINSGLRSVLNGMRKKQTGSGKQVLIAIFTNDSALLHTATLPTPLIPSYNVFTTAPGPMQEQVREFKRLLTEIRAMAGEKAEVELRLVVATLDGVSGNGAMSNPYEHSGGGTMREAEVYELSKMLARCDAESKAGTNSSSSSNFEQDREGGCSVHMVAPTSLVYEDVLRSMLVFHAPCVTSTLSFPSMHDITCNLNVQITAPTVRGADELMALKGGLDGDAIRILQVLPHTAVPAMCLEGGTFQLSAAPVTSFSEPGRTNAHKHNMLAFTALETALRDCSSILVVRLLKQPDPPRSVLMQPGLLDSGRLSATYWAVLPPTPCPSPDQQHQQQFTMIRLVDREHFLSEGASYQTDISLPVPPSTPTTANADEDEVALLQNLQTVKSYLGELTTHRHCGSATTTSGSGSGSGSGSDASSLHKEGLQALHGSTPVHLARELYNPLNYPGGEIACQITAVERDWQEQGQQQATHTHSPAKQPQGQGPTVEGTFARKRILEGSKAVDNKGSAHTAETGADTDSLSPVILETSSDESLIPEAKKPGKKTSTDKQRKAPKSDTSTTDGGGGKAKATAAKKGAGSSSRTQRYVKDAARKRAALDGSKRKAKPVSKKAKKGLSLVAISREEQLSDSLESVTDSGGGGDDFWS